MSVKKNKKSISGRSAVSRRTDPAALARVVALTRRLLAFHQELGIDSYPADDNLDRLFLQKPAPPPSPAAISQAGVADGSVGIKRKSPIIAEKDLEQLGKDISSCRRCETSAKRIVPVEAVQSPRLVVIGDCYAGNEDGSGLFWGEKEDDLFWKMMAAIGLERESVYVTNCIKCCQQSADNSDSDMAKRCYSHLEQEILAIQPKLICTLGPVATATVLKSATPFHRLRGRFHRYRYPHGGEAQLMATYHPRFLLHQPEMKSATWQDLQKVQRKLPPSPN